MQAKTTAAAELYGLSDADHGNRRAHLMHACAAAGLLAGLLAAAVRPNDTVESALMAGVLCGAALALFVTTPNVSRLLWETRAGRTLYVFIVMAVLAWLLVTDALEDLSTVLLAGYLSISVIIVTGQWRVWVFWRPQPVERNVPYRVASTVLSVVALTLTFAVLSGHLYVQDHLADKPELPHTPALQLATDYFWHFLDGVPALEIPQTLNWVEPVKLKDSLSGILLLIFKLLVIVPFVGHIAGWMKQRNDNRA